MVSQAMFASVSTSWDGASPSTIPANPLVTSSDSTNIAGGVSLIPNQQPAGSQTQNTGSDVTLIDLAGGVRDVTVSDPLEVLARIVEPSELSDLLAASELAEVLWRI
jgi:hypothetical protein